MKITKAEFVTSFADASKYREYAAESFTVRIVITVRISDRMRRIIRMRSKNRQINRVIV